MALMNEPTAPYHSAQDALRVLETVSQHTTGVTANELARQAGLGADRLTALLRMLRREGYVEQVTDGAYVTGAALGRLGSAHGREQALRDKLQQTIDRLRDSVGAAIYISRYIDGEVHVTQYAESPSTPAVNEWVDFRSSAHASAVGKSLLGQLDHNGRRDHLARHKMARLTSRTITSERLLLSRLDSQLYHRARPRPPGVCDRHGLRGGPDHHAAPPSAASPSPCRSSTPIGSAAPRTR